MPTSVNAPYLAIGVALAVVAFVVLRRLSRYGMRPADYPPGPPTLPIIGNLHQMPMKDLHLKFAKWGKQYGPVFSLKLGADMNIIVLNKDQPVKDLLDKQSSIYSVRMDSLIREYGDGLMITNRDNDDIWRRQRKAYHLLLNGNVANKYLPYQYFETTQLLQDILQRPDDVSLHLKRYTTSLGSTIAYAWRTTSIDQPAVKTMYHWIERWSAIGTQTMVTEWWKFLRPIYRIMPTWLSAGKKEMFELLDIEKRLWMSQLVKAKENIDRGNKKPCFAVDMLLNNKQGDAKDAMTDLQTAFNAGHAWAGASDTTLNTLLAFVKAMILYPDVQAKAQEEIDRVIGSERMPDWHDRDSLPYVRSCVKESLRWLPTALTGVPHSVSRDDTYMGFKIPERAVIFFNTWAINNDPSRVLNPRRFLPERHLDDSTTSYESASLPDCSKRDHFTFGAGRRICPGIHIADRSLFVAISRLLWGFKIEQGMDAEGRPIPLNADVMGPGFVAEPEKYASHFVPRTPETENKIKSEWAKAAVLLDKDGNYSDVFYDVFGRAYL
ncbi:putative cytochrome P450 [Mytilinidion resinicola]|uniref:Cytochrome P450 n=1 Tax=Mytilinidion resinicola TaxID=574789 RepID=A0A6A6YQT5_9PEZI|nr:putative cytochrome P450 [Mytilinidion resinicola]KAF2810345.1 putative cytochrome P450 [Mytilinidion resinicola]